MMHSCPEYMEECPIHIVGWMAMAALSIHNLLDGLNIAVAFQGGSQVGATVGLAICLHKFADGLALTSLFRMAGYSNRRGFQWVLLLAASTPIGTALAGQVLPQLHPSFLAAALGFTAGSFLYVGAADILPRIHKMQDTPCLLLFVLGLLSVGMIAK